MGELDRGAVGGRAAGAHHRLRAHHAFALCGVVAVAAVFVAGALLPVTGVHRPAVLAFLAAAAAAVAGPLAGAGPRPLASAGALGTGVAVAFPAVALAFGGRELAALGAGLALGGFVLLLAGLSAALSRLFRSGGAGTGLAGLAGVLLLASFHVGDPFLEWWGPNTKSDAAMVLLHAANPLSGAVGDALGQDWLRLPILYGGFPGSTGEGLTAAPYYAFRYFPWWGTALLHGGLGVLLLLAARRAFPFKGLGEVPKIRPVADFEIDGTLSVVGESCPMNYVRTKLRLEAMDPGQVLEVLVSDGEAARNVPRSAAEEGHEVLRTAPAGDDRVRILIRKREARRGS